MVYTNLDNRNRQRRAVGVFPSRQAAERALHELRDSGFPMDRVSVIAKDAENRDNIAGADIRNQGNLADEGAKVGAVSGGALGGLTGLLVGLGVLAIPGIGPVMLAGAASTALATTLTGGAIGAVTGGLLGGLIGLGIPEDRARVYSDRVARGDYLVMVEGSETEIGRAETILHHRGIEDYGVYDVPHQRDAATDVVAEPMAGVAAVPASPSHMHSTLGHSSPDSSYGQKQAIGFFSRHHDAEVAINDLRAAGFPLRQISLIGQHLERRGPFAEIDVQQRFEEGDFGLPHDRYSFLNSRVNRGDYLVIVRGNEAEIRQAANILNSRGIQEFSLYDALAQPSSHMAAPDRVATTSAREPYSTPMTGAATAGQRRRAVGVFANHREAEAALRELRDSGFSMDHVSVIAKDTEYRDNLSGAALSTSDKTKADEGARSGAIAGGALGGLGGLLVGLGALAIPGVGPVVLGGAAATALATALSGGAIGATVGGIAGGLVGLGIPEAQARRYNERFERGDYLVMVDGSEADLQRAETILNRRGVQDWGVFDAHENAYRAETVSGRTTQSADIAASGTQKPQVTIIDHRNNVPQ